MGIRITEEEQRKRVLSVMFFLDSTVPGWLDKVDLDTLNIASSGVPCRCIVGQVSRSRGRNGFCDALRDLGIFNTDISVLGFMIDEPIEDENHKGEFETRIWKEEILKRRQANVTSVSVSNKELVHV